MQFTNDLNGLRHASRWTDKGGAAQWRKEAIGKYNASLERTPDPDQRQMTVPTPELCVLRFEWATRWEMKKQGYESMTIIWMGHIMSAADLVDSQSHLKRL